MNEFTYISLNKSKGCFTLVKRGQAAPFYASSTDYPGVLRVLKHLQADIARVTNHTPELFIDKQPAACEFVLAGTLGKNPLLDKLVQEKQIDITSVAGKWEAYRIQVVENPLPGVERCLLILGSDKRGTLFGIFDLSSQIGVSPWYWWADVPVKQREALFVLPGAYTRSTPAVKYRGIFINDEAPALSRWAYEKWGGYNHKFYEKVFELLLRLKANYLWPAMWGDAFNDDDPYNAQLADEYGIVMGTSHHEPMLRAQQEWKRYGIAEWNYTTNADILKAFWRQGIKNMGDHESIITLGMRGDGDMAMSEGSDIALLEKIIAEQRKILEEVTGRALTSIPQVWVIYKEVQEYYEHGMQVPDDVTMMLCDDNWGNIRKLPLPGDRPHSGGYGLYYHFDYVGGPRNYKWINTSPIPRVWEQLHLAYQSGIDRIWIVNVGDIKPMEFPTEFFLDYAWAPDAWPAERMAEYTQLWAEKQFGTGQAPAIARILAQYTKYNSRRKPELLAPDTYSLVHYLEAETVVSDYNQLVIEAEQIWQILPPAYKDAFYQLVLHPVKACANLNALYVTVGKNHLYAAQGRAATNELALLAEKLFANDAEYSFYYNHIMADGKWNHMMDQTHISYTSWQQPEKDKLPEVKHLDIPAVSEMGVAIEGAESWWPAETAEAVLPGFDPYNNKTHYCEVFNRGQLPFDCTIRADVPWVHTSAGQVRVEKEQRIWISVDWEQAPTGVHRVPVSIDGPAGCTVTIQAVINHPAYPRLEEVEGFIESNGYISIEAPHYSHAIAAAPLYWQCIPDLGRTHSGMTLFPVPLESQIPGRDSPRLEYALHLLESGTVKVLVYLSPVLTVNAAGEVRYAVSIDEEKPQIINIWTDKSLHAWERVVRDNIIIVQSVHTLDKPGKHIVKFWAVDPGVVLQKLVVATGDVKPSYLGPPESFYRLTNNP